MGAMSFEFATPDLDLDRLAATIQIQGIDNAPWPGRVQRNDQVLTVLRQNNDSGKMSVSWPTEKGFLRIATGSIPEKPEAYQGELELARGLLNDVRNHVALWLEAGLQIDAPVMHLIEQATEWMIDSQLAGDPESAAHLATQSIDQSIECIYRLSHTFKEQVSILQKQAGRAIEFPFGILVNEEDLNAKCAMDQFTHLAISPSKNSSNSRLSELDNVRADQKRILGPFVDVSQEGIIRDGMEGQSFEDQRRMIGKRLGEMGTDALVDADIVHAVAGIDGIGHRQMSFPHQLQIAMDSIQAIQTKTNNPILVSFSNPFGDQVARSLGGSIAIQIADEMLRRGSQIGMLGLEINIDFLPQGDVAGHPFLWLELLDQWSFFGIPLILFLRMPSVETEPVGAANWRREPIWHSMSLQQRVDYFNVLIPLLATRAGVESIIWNNRFTGTEQRFAAAARPCDDQNHLFDQSIRNLSTSFG